ncbi:MAG: hypothetical protein A4E45_02018 [Methanosaeta sp. PtaB.Bin039]|nr:MAG: hypothetical protein A4E45_02018 [Methanosaeta sp. PtaB.Bin039]
MFHPHEFGEHQTRFHDPGSAPSKDITIRILGRLHRTVTELDVRRAFTSFQLMTILEENHHSFLIVEHDPILYEDSKDMVECVAQRLRQTSREATILLYSPSDGPAPAEDGRAGRSGVLLLRGAESADEGQGQVGVQGREEPDDARGVFVNPAGTP